MVLNYRQMNYFPNAFIYFFILSNAFYFMTGYCECYLR